MDGRISIDDIEVEKTIKLVYSDVKGNNNKFWQATLLSGDKVEVKWGRVGGSGDSQEKELGSEYAAKNFMQKKCNEKLRKGYTLVDVISTSENVPVSESLKDIVKTQITTDNKETVKLIEMLTEKNVHNILNSTVMQYKADSGLFSTPLGIVTDKTINNARDTLDEILNYVMNKDFSNNSYHILLNKYLRLIPQKVGYKLNPETLYKDVEAVKKQYDILDSLEVSYNTYLSNKKLYMESESGKKNLPKLFSCEIKDITSNKTIFKKVEEKYYDTNKSYHSASSLKPVKIYSIKIDEMHDRFTLKGSKIGNVKELWHGTRTQNLLSILKSGLIIPPERSSHVTGRMFGNGIYFSDQSTKALNYSYGYWSGSSDNNCFMFLADVAMGKEYTPGSSYEKLPKPGYDSTFAKAHKSGVINNEMIVYNLKQVNLKYLVEFKK